MIERFLLRFLDWLEIKRFQFWYESVDKIRRPDCIGCIGIEKEGAVFWMQNCLYHKN